MGFSDKKLFNKLGGANKRFGEQNLRENVKCTKYLFLAVPGQIIQERDYFRKKSGLFASRIKETTNCPDISGLENKIFLSNKSCSH